MQFLILGWLVLVLTDSSSQLGLVVFLYGVPNLAFVLFGGIIADRIDRRKMLIGTQAAVQRDHLHPGYLDGDRLDSDMASVRRHIIAGYPTGN